MLKHSAGAGRPHTLGAEIVLDRQGKSGKGAETLSSGTHLIDPGGVLPGPFRGDFDENVECRIGSLKPLEVLVNQFSRGNLATLQLLTPRADRHRPAIDAEATTLSAQTQISFQRRW